MNSGVYKLLFPSGKFYIGKTCNFERRWAEHFTKLSKGTGAARMQAEFNKYGDFKAIVLIECHEDHIDILEAYYINALWSCEILNGIKPSSIDEQSCTELLNLAHYSTIDHCRIINSNERKIKTLEKELAKAKSGTLIETLETELFALHQQVAKLREKEKPRSFFERIFGV